MLKKSLNNKIRVLHVVGSMQAGGLETLIMNIYRNIDRSKVQFDFTVHTTEKCFYDDEIIELGGNIYRHPKPKGDLKSFKSTLERTINDNGPYDVIHSHVLFFSGVVLEVAKKCKVPIRIAHSHNTSDSKKDSIYRNIYRYFMRKKILKNATNLIGCSREACEYVFGKSSYESGKAIHFPNAIDFTKYKGITKSKKYLTKELKIEEDSILIGHIGRFTRQKNHAFLLKVFASYYKNEKKAHLILVGEGNEKDSINRLVKNMNLEDKVHFLGLRNDIPKILSSLDLFLFPSLYEGLGIVIVEAQAAQTPCLISKNIPEEADIKVGLVKKVGLEENINEKWVKGIQESLSSERIESEIIESALKKNGYDIIENSSKLIAIYQG